MRDIIEAIDKAIDDYAVSDDAMRWTPEAPADPDGEWASGSYGVPITGWVTDEQWNRHIEASLSMLLHGEAFIRVGTGEVLDPRGLTVRFDNRPLGATPTLVIFDEVHHFSMVKVWRNPRIRRIRSAYRQRSRGR